MSTLRRAERIRRPATAWGAALLVLGAVALGVGGLLLSRSSIAHARGIEVSGNDHLSRREVVALAAVSRATNVLWLDEGKAERSLETHPWVADAHVHVAVPATIRIEIVERVPVAVVSDGIGRTLVAADGTSLGAASRRRGLPRIRLPMAGVDGRAWPVGAITAPHGPRPSSRGAAAALGSMSPEVRADVRSILVLVDGTLDLRLQDGITVRYGAPAAGIAKAQTLDRILAWARATGNGIVHVNVVSPLAPAVRLAA